jgi:hypothetical protein
MILKLRYQILNVEKQDKAKGKLSEIYAKYDISAEDKKTLDAKVVTAEGRKYIDRYIQTKRYKQSCKYLLYVFILRCMHASNIHTCMHANLLSMYGFH